jgi:hypothetical protein
MNWDLAHIPDVLRPALAEKLARLADMGTGTQQGLPSAEEEQPAGLSALPLVWACSDFVADACLRDATLLRWLCDGRQLSEGVTEDELNADLAAGLDPAGDGSGAVRP